MHLSHERLFTNGQDVIDRRLKFGINIVRCSVELERQIVEEVRKALRKA